MTERAPKLAPGVQLRHEEEATLLLVPEGAMFLNGTAAAVAELIDGRRTTAEIVDELCAQFAADPEQIEGDVRDLLERLRAQGVLQ
jgi:coenzyme PQQ biosynthesis protein PqqD